MSGAYIVITASLVNLAGTLYYVRNTVKGTTKPNRMTWLMWSIAPTIGSAAALVSGAGWAALPVFMAGFCPLLVFLASFVNKNAYWKLGRFDYWCGVLSALALILWWITGNPTVAVVFAIASDFLAGIPTFIKSWRYPETETATGFVANGINNLTSFLVIRQWTFANYAFPAYLVAADTLIAFFILRKYLSFKKE